MTALNDRRDAICDFIKSYTKEHRYPPTVREIGAAVELTSTSTVKHYLHALRNEGRITFVPGSPRTIVVQPKRKRAA